MEAQRATQGEKNMESQLEELHAAVSSLDEKYREASGQAFKHGNEKRQLLDEIEQLRREKYYVINSISSLIGQSEGRL